MIRSLILFILVITLHACQTEGRVYAEHQDLSPDLEWLKKDSREFKVPIEDSSLAYNLSISLRYATGYQYQIAKVKVTETSPSGDERVLNYDLKLRADNGDYIGEPGYDIWDSEHLVEIGLKYEEIGTYSYLIEHDMPVDPLHLLMEVGLVIDLAK